MMISRLVLYNSVGQGGRNAPGDVRCVRALLNVDRRRHGDPSLAVDMSAGQELASAIARFQGLRGVSVASGLVRPGSVTWQWLLESLAQARTRLPVVPPASGQLTWDAEGQEGGARHSRVLRVPASHSGVIVGRGYDLHLRSRVEAEQMLIAAGIDPVWSRKLAGAAHLQGDAARDFVLNQDLLDVEISPEQQMKLFEQSYRQAIDEARRQCEDAALASQYGAVQWLSLDHRIRDVLADLQFRGEYSGPALSLLQPAVVANNRQALAGVMSNSALWPYAGADRRMRRQRHLQ